jgi:hypothetical protein
MDRPDFTNMNGLVGGRIPKGVQCPFRHQCVFCDKADVTMPKDWRCKRHTPEAMENNFSCATARMFSIIENANKGLK